jgi:hypothetical protein
MDGDRGRRRRGGEEEERRGGVERVKWRKA